MTGPTYRNITHSAALHVINFIIHKELFLSSAAWEWNVANEKRKRNSVATSAYEKYKLLCPRGTQTCALALANIAHAVYLLDVAKRPIPQG